MSQNIVDIESFVKKDCPDVVKESNDGEEIRQKKVFPIAPNSCALSSNFAQRIEIFKDYFSKLPTHVIINIFRFVSIEDMFSLVQVCKRFSNQDSNDFLWRDLCHSRWYHEGLFGWTEEEDPPRPSGCRWKWIARSFLIKITPEKKTSGVGFFKGEQSFYLGEWRDGERHGRGLNMNTKVNDQKYFGEWDHNEASGRGVMIWKKGVVYEGEWKNNKPQGRGVKRWELEGDSYEGEWSNGRMHGQGVYFWKSGARYDGNWKDGNMHGRGSKIWSSGTRYEGFWENDEPNGEGIKYFSNGDVQKGEWKNNLEEGFGDYKSCFGTTYIGNYTNGMPHGSGCFTHPDGYSWSGSWINGLPEAENEAVHPKLRKVLSEGRCTRAVTGNVPFYGQVLFRCNNCDHLSDEKKLYLCRNCMTKCHKSHRAINDKTIWTVGRTFCSCRLCNPSTGTQSGNF